MARRNPAEIAAGAAVLLVAAGFLTYALANTGTAGGGYRLHASFDHIDGLTVGSDVRMAGVKIGSVLGETIDPKTFLADVTLSVRGDIRLPTDSSAEVTSDGLLGGKYLALAPGGETRTIPPGGTVTITQGSISLEQLLGKFIFSVTDMVNANKPASGQGSGVSGGVGNPPGTPSPTAGALGAPPRPGNAP